MLPGIAPWGRVLVRPGAGVQMASAMLQGVVAIGSEGDGAGGTQVGREPWTEELIDEPLT